MNDPIRFPKPSRVPLTRTPGGFYNGFMASKPETLARQAAPSGRGEALSTWGRTGPVAGRVSLFLVVPITGLGAGAR
jgi:hypothetical protein